MNQASVGRYKVRKLMRRRESISIVVDTCPGSTMSIPAVPTISICPNSDSFRKSICLPSSCQSRTWQLVTCQENRQPSSTVPSDCVPASCRTTCLPSTSSVGFACQPLCSFHKACCESGPAQSTCLANSCQPPCSESAGCQIKGGGASLCQQGSCQEPVCVSRSHQEACHQSVCFDTRSCHPSCPEVTPCPETSCPPTICVSDPCQPSCCQASSCRPIGCESQPCTTYYQPVCYMSKPCPSVSGMCVRCQPSMYVFNPCSPLCWVPSSWHLLPCQPAPRPSFICQPVANCQLPCSVKNPCKSVPGGTRLPGKSNGGGPPSCNPNACKSPPCQPACCVTGLGKSSSGVSNGLPAPSTSFCKAKDRVPTPCQPGPECSFRKATLH
ncbi:keratin-associated protein 29-1 [Echinops telfairi]|uniref:Keratin-associated protein 29-1 n=1 Tax=Echinops telfairi TaxID=9371 RepID=A0ABM0ZRI3_ECHTE|nr:keratin-associated protein 29-1 [Echinops telfairi]